MPKLLIQNRTKYLKALFIIAITTSTVYSIYKNGFTYEPIFILNTVLRPIVLTILVLISSEPKERSVSSTSLIGMVISFFGVFFLNAFPIKSSPEILWIYQSTVFFYTLFLVWSLISLGKNFGFLPALRSISKNGSYQIVRHPIYSSYIHIIVSCLAIFPNVWNLIASIFTILGLYIRIHEEEKLLVQLPEYQEFKHKTHAKIFHPILTLPLIILFICLFANQKSSVVSRTNKRLVVISASTIQSLNPTEYDEWGAVFIGNHIYPRLLPDETPDRSFAIGTIKEQECLPNNENCEFLKFKIQINEQLACNGSKLNANVVKSELKTILYKKNWILEDWSFCKSETNNEICIQTRSSPDIDRKLRTIYFRFGFSLHKAEDKKIGVGPYCLIAKKYQDQKISEALLLPLNSSLPEIIFSNSELPNLQFDIALYGIDSLITSQRHKISTHTPMGIYVVTNPKFKESLDLPWLTSESNSVIALHLKKHGFLADDTNSFESIVPSGALKKMKLLNKTSGNSNEVKFIIPDYFNDCTALADKLQKLWSEKFSSSRVLCADLSKFIPQQVLSEKPSWDGFILPLTPGGYFRQALQKQYFSAYSNESWIKGTNSPEEYFYLIGIAPTNIITSKKICSLKPNPVGLSDLSVKDINYCD